MIRRPPRSTLSSSSAASDVYKRQNKTSISVTLEDEAYGIDEVVAIGYGTQKRANIVGAVASVDGEQLQAIPAMNVSNAISGLIPGTTIIQQTGEPGQGSPRIMIRGRSTVNSCLLYTSD